MAQKNSRFLPYYVTVHPPKERDGRWTAQWFGREYQCLHAAPIPLARKPIERVLREASAWSPRAAGEGFAIAADGSMSVYVATGGAPDEGRANAEQWGVYCEALGKLVRHLRPAYDASDADGDGQLASDPPRQFGARGCA